MQHQNDTSKSETLMLAHVPNWIKDRYGFRPNRSTVFRWKTRGCRGKRLKTFRVGGRVCTSVEALLEFFSDEDNGASSVAPATNRTVENANAFLVSEGM